MVSILVSSLAFSILVAFGLGRNLPHLSVMTFYDMDIPLQVPFTNVYRGSIADCYNATITKSYNMTVLVELPDGVFTRHCKPPCRPNSLYDNWFEVVANFSKQLMDPLQSGTALGVFLGDEICCSGTPYVNLSSVADALRHFLGPAAWLYTNECSEMAQWPPLRGGLGGVPPSLDAISVDFYDEHNTNGSAEVEKNFQFYHKEIFPRLRSHQKALFVPGIFASSPAGCATKNISCPLASQAAQIVLKLRGFFEWALRDQRIVGFNPWHFANRSHPQFPLPWDQRLGAVAMPPVVQKLSEIGSFIKQHNTV